MQGEKFPFTLAELCKAGEIDDVQATKTGDMFLSLYKGIEHLISDAEAIYKVAPPGLETKLGDYCVDLTKLCWKLAATLGKP
jgi:hypothetical protein